MIGKGVPEDYAVVRSVLFHVGVHKSVVEVNPFVVRFDVCEVYNGVYG